MCSRNSFAFFFCFSLSRVVVSASLERRFFAAKILRVLFLSVEGSSSSFTRARPSPLFFILSLDDNSAHARDATDKNGSFCQRAREHIQRERERTFDRTTHTQHTHFFSSLCGDKRDELNGLLFIGAFFCLFRRREQQQQREKKRKRNSRGFWRQLQR